MGCDITVSIVVPYSVCNFNNFFLKGTTMSEKSYDDVSFDELVAVNSNLIDETKPTARFFELRSAHRDYPLIAALSDAFPAVFVEDVHGCEPTYWNVGGHYRDPATMPETVLRWYVLRALRHDTDADPDEYIDDYEMFASTTALCKKLIEELEHNHEYKDSVVCDPETGEFMFDYADPDFGEDAPETVEPDESVAEISDEFSL